MNVSIIIPAYNAAGTITETLESVLAQTYPNWEAIVVDDGSTDATAEITKGFAKRDARINLVSQPNGGESAARNTGIARAHYDWLLFLDADDWISHLHLERMTTELIADPELDAVHCLSVRIAGDGTEVADSYQPPVGDLFPTLARRAAFPVHACIVRRSLVEAVGGFDTSLKKSPDWDLWQRIARTGARFGAVRQVLAYYRMQPNSASLGAEQMFSDGLRVLKRGHSPDPRVQNPHPDYADGLPPEQIHNQKFYLLCWCAGLLLGTGRDAKPLLGEVEDDHCAELYPDAIARCIFEAAPLPACQPPQFWERLWPKAQPLIEEFFGALEERSMTSDLARCALIELKKLILKHSLAWRDVIEAGEQVVANQQAVIEHVHQRGEWLEEERTRWQQRTEELEQARGSLEDERANWQRRAEDHEQAIEKQQALIDELKESKALLEEARSEWQRRAEDHEQTIEKKSAHIEEMEHVRQLLEGQRSNWQRLAEERESILVKLQKNGWVRLGLRLGVLKPADTVDPAPGLADRSDLLLETDYSDDPPGSYKTEKIKEGKWQLRVAGGSVAGLVFPPDKSETVRIDIKKARTRTRWNIQLNQPHLKVQSNQRYSVHFRARAYRPRNIFVGFAQAHEPWDGLGLYKQIKLTPDWQDFQEDFIATADDDNGRIHFDLGGSRIAVEVSSVSLRSLSDEESIEADLPAMQTGEPERDGAPLEGGVIVLSAGPRS